MKTDFLNELNESQRDAVTYCEGPLLVIAGAGSGKTRVLTYKIAYLMEIGYSPSSILALTFTNKAAREMKSRIGKIVGENRARYLWMGTFHAVFSRLLRNEAEIMGYSKNFTIYDSADSKNLVKAIVKELKLDDKIYKPGFVHSRISFAKNNLITPQAYATNSDYIKSDNTARVPRLADIYAIYCNRCKQSDVMDFDDLLLNTNLLFRNHSEILQKYQSLFKYILVDEYQDTNFSQYMIVKKLAECHEHICVVGDDAQSIYSFRGANIDNILQFRNAYKNSRIFKLEQNYRSTQNIVNAANSLIDKNVNRIKKNVFSEKAEGDLIKVLNVSTDLEEGEVVARNIVNLHRNKKLKYDEIAILYRTNSQSRVLEEAMRKSAVPYRIYGGLSFYQRKEIKDVIAYCRLVCNHNDEEALKRIINYPARGIGDTTINKLTECAQLHNVSHWEVLSDMLKYNLPVNSGTTAKLANFRDMIDVFSQQLDTQNAYDLVNSIIKITGIISDTYVNISPENQSRQENVQEFLKAVHEFCEIKQSEGSSEIYLPDFLAEIALVTDQDEKSDNNDRITMMTVHAAKGLEFRVVFIVGMEEDLFPSAFSESERDLEEERRLFYVAITRAEELCFISHSRTRFRNGKTNFSNPSRFISDIDSQYLDITEEENMFVPKQKHFSDWDDDWNIERNLFSNRKASISHSDEPKTISSSPKKLVKIKTESGTPIVCNIPVGAFVKHPIFGIGKVLSTNLVDGNEKAEIDFGEKGKKSLLLKFAKLEVMK